jgi:DUF4097 and DUF4098 domain-containing protein YvlB
MNHEFASPGPVSADLRIASGQLNVQARDTQTITVSVDPMDGSANSREAAEQTRVHLEGKHLVVHTPNHKNWALFRWPKLRITVVIPQESVLNVKAASADVRLDGIYNDLVAHTASGELTVDRVTKDATVNSASGDIRIASVGGDLRMTTASGDQLASDIGRDVSATSASGDIEIGRINGSSQLKSASGDIKIGQASAGEIKVHSASGDVTIGITAGTGVWLDLSTASGRTTSDLAMNGAADPPPGASAGLRVKVRTASGDIMLRRVAVEPAV